MVDQRDLAAVLDRRRDIAARLVTTSSQQAMLGRIGHRKERAALEQAAQQLNRQLATLGNDLVRLETAISDRQARLHHERVWAHDHPDTARQLARAERTLEQDAITRGRTVAVDPPSYLTEALGRVPADPSGRLEWERIAGRIEQHRAVYDITDRYYALGVEPAWNDASDRAIEHLRLQRTIVADRTPSISRDVEPRHGPVLEL